MSENKFIDFSKTKDYRKQLFPISYYKDKIRSNEKIKNEVTPAILENCKLLENNSPKGWLTNKILTSFSGEPNGKEIFFDQLDLIKREG